MKRQWQNAFLVALENTGSVTAAAEAAKISRVTVYQNRRDDPAFSQRWDHALEQSADALEAEARTRAFAGSDVLLIFLLKGLRPQRWRESRSSIAPSELNKMIENEFKRLANQNDASEGASDYPN
jgi:hypothetical protein